MKAYSGQNIRNISLLGHSSSGKTTFTEAALYATKVINRQGRVEDKNTVSDFDKEEIARGVSIGTSVIPVEHHNTKFNILDTPGYFDFVGEMYGAKRVSDGSIILVDAQSGVEVGTEKAWNNVEKYNTPRLIFLNKMDKENVVFDKVYQIIKQKLGDKVIPFTIPIGEADTLKGYFDVLDKKAYEYNGADVKETEASAEYAEKAEKYIEALNEIVAESSEELMEKYFSGEAFTQEEFIKGIKTAVSTGELCPLFVGVASEAKGVLRALEACERYLPSPAEHPVYKGLWNDEIVERKPTEDEPFSAVVFKTIVDPFVGKLSLFKVISGTMDKNTHIYNSTEDKDEKSGGLFFLRGKNQVDTDMVKAGDIAATSKLNYTKTGDTLCDKDNPIVYETIRYPQPTLYMAVYPKKQGEEEKVGTSLNKLSAEDPSFIIDRNSETKELLVGGQGNMQLQVISDKLKNRFGVEIELRDPKIAYRETIKATASVQGKHKKQSGGAGQYGDVWIRFEPCEEDFVFAEEVFGGAVPKNYFPAVEKGLRDSIEHGVLAGYPVVKLKAVLYDGSYHDVDSNEMAFKLAAQLAFKKGMQEAKPILLEPIVKAEITIPDEYLGDVMGDMNKRRGRILGMEQQRDGTQKLIAEAPHAEMFQYAIDLRAMTQARGSFTMEFIRYEEVPGQISEKIQADYKNEE
ncbi:MAG: elongation factor G [Tissierellia bacterium]|nr:elongation factor G [Tissierellia bacterium]